MAKFKKLAIISSAVLMTTAFAFGVAACGEEVCAHTYEKKSDETHTWYACTQEGCDSVVGKEEIVTPHVHTFALQKNDSKHWYECSDETCTEKVGEADHVWDEGEETLAPQVGVAGEYTYTCRVCGQTDVEAVNALTPNPLLVAEGSVVAKDSYGQAGNVTLAMEAGSYIITTSSSFDDAWYNINVNDYEYYQSSNECQFEVATAGDVTFALGVMSNYDEADVTVNYVIKKVPSITPDVSEMEGTAEIVTYAWVKVNVTIPVAGKFAIGSEDAVFSEYAGGGNYAYVFTTTEANEAVTFYTKALDDSEEKTTISYAVAQLEATELSEGANAVYLWGFTGTDVTFTAPAAGAYKFVTFDDSFAVYKEYDWDLCNKLNGIYYFEAEEANEVISFAISGMYDVATFAIEEFPDEERYTSVVTFDQETGEGYANLKAGSTATFTLLGMGTRTLTWESGDLAVSVNDIVATTQSIAFNLPNSMMMGSSTLEISVTNNSSEDIEETFKLGYTIDSSVEVYVPKGESVYDTMALDVVLTAGNYFVSVNSTTVQSASYNGTALSTTAVEITATGDVSMPDTLQILGNATSAEMVVVAIIKPGTAESPYVIASAGQTFENVGAAVSIYNPMARADAYQIYFSYTATSNGTLSWAFAEEYPQYTVSNVAQSDDNWSDYNPYNNPYQFTVQAGITYTLTFEFLDMMGMGAPTTSPTFTFTAANA